VNRSVEGMGALRRTHARAEPLNSGATTPTRRLNNQSFSDNSMTTCAQPRPSIWYCTQPSSTAAFLHSCISSFTARSGRLLLQALAARHCRCTLTTYLPRLALHRCLRALHYTCTPARFTRLPTLPAATFALHLPHAASANLPARIPRIRDFAPRRLHTRRARAAAADGTAALAAHLYSAPANVLEGKLYSALPTADACKHFAGVARRRGAFVVRVYVIRSLDLVNARTAAVPYLHAHATVALRLPCCLARRSP